MKTPLEMRCHHILRRAFVELSPTETSRALLSQTQIRSGCKRIPDEMLPFQCLETQIIRHLAPRNEPAAPQDPYRLLLHAQVFLVLTTRGLTGRRCGGGNYLSFTYNPTRPCGVDPNLSHSHKCSRSHNRKKWDQMRTIGKNGNK